MGRTKRPRDSKKDGSMKKESKKGVWTAEEDRRLAQVVEIHGSKKWESVASKAGLNRCGKSCRLRWMNYLRPNIKRGNISDQEEDLILRLHRLLGNRWSLIAGRLPGRTDNEIKNYWNCHLSKKINQKQMPITIPKADLERTKALENDHEDGSEEGTSRGVGESDVSFHLGELLDFSSEVPLDMEWVTKFLETDEGLCQFS
ncbi:hypothetical protein NE237_029857 [Protea cynaroides]|uniref:Uncharacterized protein n=1 Tax=Protea cynaroides TaxID=273540 RepID=A0A9Q0GT32_9MAGN|nr:hypothetical protein NE237_029857 [Protea cynaroides]